MRKSVLTILLAVLVAALPGYAKPHKSSASHERSGASSSSKKSGGAKSSSKRAAAAHSSSKKAAGKASSSKGSRAAGSRSHARGTTRTAKGRGRGSSSSAKAQQQARRAYQQAPTPDRYREIQAALAEKGFFKGEPNGVWDANSVEALKAFQREKSLNPTGKLDAVSLIALGLGPKRTTTADTTPLLIQRPQDDNRRTEGSERP